MSIYFTDEHLLFRETVRRFVAREIAPHAEEWERQGGCDRQLYRRLGELGYLGIRFPTSDGGAGADWFYYAIFAEEMCRGKCTGVAVDVLLHMEAATHCIRERGNQEQKQEFLAPAIRGERIAALGVTEPDTGSDVAGIRTTARRVGDEYLINGAKMFITNGTVADFITLAVRTGEPGPRGISLVLFPTDTPGFGARKLDKLGARSSDTAELSFADCRIPARYLLGNENEGFRYIMEAFDGEKITLALLALGLMDTIFAETQRYGLERQVFGQAVLKHQYWRHKMAEVGTRIETARHLIYHAVYVLNQGGAATLPCAMAKLYATETVKWVATACAQAFGGYGYMEEYPIARLYRDVMGFTVGAGTSEIMREIIADGIGLRVPRRPAGSEQ